MRISLLCALALGFACAEDKAPDENKGSVAVADDKTADDQPVVDKPATETGYAADMKRICNAKALSGADKETDPRRRIEVMVTWLRANIETEEGKKLLASMASVIPSERGDRLRSEARKVGLESCQMADDGGK